jgi:hypothetical protein
MKIFKPLLLTVAVIFAGSVTTACAQTRPKSNAALAAYGMSPVPSKKQIKKQKSHKNKQQPKTYQTREPKIIKEKKAAYRKRSNWAS